MPLNGFEGVGDEMTIGATVSFLIFKIFLDRHCCLLIDVPNILFEGYWYQSHAPFFDTRTLGVE
jgi:hypothetical protein